MTTPVTTVSILRELPTARDGGVAASYRLVLTCNSASHVGEMQFDWAPSPKAGTLLIAVDGNAPSAHRVEGTERMGNGSGGAAGPATVRIYDSMNGSPAARMSLPVRSLAISNLFPNEAVAFPFGDLTPTARRSLAECFAESNTRQ